MSALLHLEGFSVDTGERLAEGNPGVIVSLTPGPMVAFLRLDVRAGGPAGIEVLREIGRILSPTSSGARIEIDDEGLAALGAVLRLAIAAGGKGAKL